MWSQTMIIGRLTRDPELRHTQAGTAVASFTVAVDEGYGENKKTVFYKCSAWAKTGEAVVNYTTKGQLVFVSGTITTRDYEKPDANGNITKVDVWELKAQEVKFLSRNNASDGDSQGAEISEDRPF